MVEGRCERCQPFQGILVTFALFFVLAALSACGREETIDRSPPGAEREEWFWRDRLSRRPEALPMPAPPPALTQEVDAFFQGLAGRDPLSLRNEIEALARLGPKAAPLLRDRAAGADRSERYLAIAALGRIGGPHAQEPLLGALRDEWSTAAILAADSLIGSGEPWIIPRLIKTIGPYPIDFNPNLMTRVKASRALLNLGNYSTVPFLIKILKENTPAEDPIREWHKTYRLAWEKEEALAALSSLSGDTFGFNVDASRPAQAESALEFESWWLENRDRFWEQAPLLDDDLLAREIRDIIDGLNAYQMRNKDGSHFMLRMLGPPVFAYLEEALESKEFYIRFHTLDVIGELAPLAGGRAGAWAGAVARSLKDPAPAVRVQACRALGLLGRAGSIPLLEELLGDPDGDVRLKAVDSLGRIGGTAGERCLDDLLSGIGPGQLRVEVLAALVRISPRWTDPFLAELQSDDPARQDWALQKVVDLTGDDFDFPLGGSAETRASAAAAIGRALETLAR